GEAGDATEVLERPEDDHRLADDVVARNRAKASRVLHGPGRAIHYQPAIVHNPIVVLAHLRFGDDDWALTAPTRRVQVRLIQRHPVDNDVIGADHNLVTGHRDHPSDELLAGVGGVGVYDDIPARRPPEKVGGAVDYHQLILLELRLHRRADDAIGLDGE